MQFISFNANAPGRRGWRPGHSALQSSMPVVLTVSAVLIAAYHAPVPEPSFREGRTLVIRDVSGSMNDSPRLIPLLARLDSVGLARSRHFTCSGGGISSRSSGGNLLRALESQLPLSNAPQILIVSDFRLDTAGWDDNDSDGFERLRLLLRQVSPKELHVISLGGVVSPELVEIVKSTGGAVMEDWR